MKVTDTLTHLVLYLSGETLNDAPTHLKIKIYLLLKFYNFVVVFINTSSKQSLGKCDEKINVAI